MSLIRSLNPGQVERAAVHSHVIKFHCQRLKELVIQLLLIMCLHFTHLYIDEGNFILEVSSSVRF